MLIMLAAAAALAGCNKESHTIVGGPDAGDTNNTTAKAPVALPPSIASSKAYRCSDSSLVYVDWMSDGSAHVRTKSKDELPTVVAAGSPDLKGDPKSPSVTYKGKTCNG
jgi:hypothetical protein